MRAFDKPLADAVLQHAVDLTRVEAGLRAKVKRRLSQLQRDLLNLLAANDKRLGTKAEMEAFFRHTRLMITRTYADVEQMMRPALSAVAKTQANSIVNAIGKAKRNA